MLSLPTLTILVSCAALTQVASAPNSADSAKISKTYKRCKTTDPHLPECLKSALQVALSELVKGIPSLGVLPLDPLEMTHLEIAQGNGPVSVRLDFTDLFIHGIGSAIITSVVPNLKNYSININADLKKPIILDGKYKVNGKVLILPITGAGKCKLVLEGFKAKIFFNGKIITKHGNKYLEITEFIFKFSTTKLRLKLENLFNGDKALGDNMNTFLNDNWEEILKELQPSFEDSLGQAFLEISNRIFLKVPFDHFFLN